jgi:hypothetical protein
MNWHSYGRRMRQKVASIRHNLNLVRTFIGGYREFQRTGTTSMSARASLRELYWRTNGRFNDLVAFTLGLQNRPNGLDTRTGVLGPSDELELGKAVSDIRTRGYHVFNRRLPEEMCDDLLTFAKTTASRPLVTAPNDDMTAYNVEYGAPITFDGTNPKYVTYDFDPQQAMKTPTAQKILTEPWLLSVAQNYLRCKPVNDAVSFWWSTAASKKPSSEAAQLYHFDMDMIKFVKIFVYVTDVTKDTGPHCYVAGSHRRKPKALLRDGRFSDEEIRRHYYHDDIVEIVGPKGTIFIADTRGFHKGKPPATGSRLMFQAEFSVSLFGANFPPIEVTDAFTPEFIDAMRRHPYTYSKFVKSSD